MAKKEQCIEYEMLAHLYDKVKRQDIPIDITVIDGELKIQIVGHKDVLITVRNNKVEIKRLESKS